MIRVITNQTAEHHSDTSRTVTTYDETGAVTSTRPYTEAENAAADAELADAATLTDLAARVASIEAHLWPAPDDPTTPDDPTVSDWAALGGIWPDQGLLREGGTVWRNVSSVPLTTPPSGFPGQPQQWDHLFVAALTAEPEPPAPTVPAWSASASYKVGDVVSHDGQVWECKVAHGPEQQGMWRPGVAHTVWTAVP